jgi:hypothetical protein
MSWQLPNPGDFWKAVEIYLAAAYEGPCPGAVRTRVDSLRTVPEADLFRSSSFEPTPKEQPTRLALRLGNPWYPHMKLVIEVAPDQQTSLFRADTHDRHIHVAPESREYTAFCEMMGKNQTLASRIEADWEAAGLATFKSFLRQDLARRQAGLA